MVKFIKKNIYKDKTRVARSILWSPGGLERNTTIYTLGRGSGVSYEEDISCFDNYPPWYIIEGCYRAICTSIRSILRSPGGPEHARSQISPYMLPEGGQEASFWLDISCFATYPPWHINEGCYGAFGSTLRSILRSPEGPEPVRSQIPATALMRSSKVTSDGAWEWSQLAASSGNNPKSPETKQEPDRSR